MVNYTNPIYQAIDRSFASLLTFDTSDIKLYVKENNSKTLNSLINNSDVDPYNITYSFMLSQAISCPDTKQQYINDHFYYADKFTILTNCLDIVRHITFLDDDFKVGHPEMPAEKKDNFFDENKFIGNSSSLKSIGFLFTPPRFPL